MKTRNKFIGISGAALMALSALAPVSTAFAATNTPTTEASTSTQTTSAKVESDKTQNTSDNDAKKNVAQEDNSPLHVKGEDSKDARKQYSAMGPGYYTQASINLYNSIGHYSPFMSFYVNPQQTNFLNRIKPTVLKAKLLPSIMAAQAILESAWGSSAPGHNLFGIKWTGTGPYVYSGTQEYGNGGYYNTGARFRAYSSDEESMQDYIRFFKENSRYKNIFNQTDYHTVARLLYQDGYATDVNYPSKIIYLIDTYGLAGWDKEAGGSSVAPVGTIGEPEDIAQIKYTPGYGVLAFQNNGKSIAGSNRWYSLESC